MNYFFQFKIISLILFSGLLIAQSKKSRLEVENEKLRTEINSLTTNLSKNNKKAESLLGYVQDLEKKIQAREKIIQNIAYEKNVLHSEIEAKQSEIKILKEEIKKLKEQYKKVLINSYKRKNETNSLLFIFSADDFSQMYRRYEYIKTYGDHRKKQVQEIKGKELIIKENITLLEKDKEKKANLLEEQKLEKLKVNREKKEQKNLLAKLEAKKGEIIAQIKVKEGRAKKVQIEIQAIIKKEIQIAKEKAEKEARLAKKKVEETRSKSVSSIPMTKESRALSSSFVANKGKLPWPVSKGRITQGYGKQKYPGLSNVYVNNNGVDIGTNKGAYARAVFKGKVSAIISIPGGNKAVLIQHGKYFSVYNNLKEIQVKKGEMVSTKQSLGKIYTDSNTGKTTLNFQVWENSSKQNPTYWINN